MVTLDNPDITMQHQHLSVMNQKLIGPAMCALSAVLTLFYVGSKSCLFSDFMCFTLYVNTKQVYVTSSFPKLNNGCE